MAEDMGLESGGEEAGYDEGQDSQDVSDESQEQLVDGGQQEEASDDPYKARFDELERRYGESERRYQQLEAAFQNAVQQRYQPRSMVPQALSKDPSTWSPQDLLEYNNYTMDQRFQAITQEQQARGMLNAQSLGEGYDFDSVVNHYLYQNDAIQSDPTSMNFIRNLAPLERYILGAVHEMAARSRGNPVRAIQAMRNALGARQDGARDIQKAVSSRARNTNMQVFRGGRSVDSGGPRDVWAMSDEQFKQLADRRGR